MRLRECRSLVKSLTCPSQAFGSMPFRATRDEYHMSQPNAAIPTTRVSMLVRCSAGCNDSWQAFFRIYAPIVFRYARHAGLVDCDAEEVVANVMRNFVLALRGGFQVDYARGRFRDYLRKVANHEIAAQRRRCRGHAALEDVAEPAAPQPGAERWAEVEQQERLRTCLEKLRTSARVRPRDLQAFERYALLGEPAERVAAELGVSTSRIYAIKNEIVTRLRALRVELDAILGEV